VVAGILPLPAWGKHAGVSYSVRAPAEPTERWLRRRSARQLRALADALQQPAAEDNPGHRRAADAYDAACLLSDRPQELLDLVASIVLARDGLMAIIGTTATPPPPCYLNPLHGRSRRTMPWVSASIWCPHRIVPACLRCASRWAALDTQVLRSPDAAGRPLPYFQIQGYWARTGFGAFEPDLPQRVLERLKVN
jgi:hypothetical protein